MENAPSFGILRPEARPFTWHELTNSQQRVGRRVLEAMHSAVIKLGPPNLRVGWAESEGRDSRTLHLERDRSNQAVMISGERGAGKTSLLLTLQDLTAITRHQSVPNAIESPVPVPEGLKGRVVWLETLDLEPFPTGSSLLAAIMARIEWRIRPGFDAWPGLDERSDPYNFQVQDAWSQFDRLANDIALAWDSSPAGATHQDVDLEIAARDKRRAEQARMWIRRRLEETLDRLAADMGQSDGPKNPLFVLPVDDLDLNPRRCLDVLRLLRAMAGKRILPLLLGDVGIATEVLDLSMQGDLVSLLGSAPYTPEQADRIRSMGSRLAAEAVRKLIPPAQTLVIGNFELAEALDFRPAPDEASIHQEHKTVRELLTSVLERISPVSDDRRPSLKELFGLARNDQMTSARDRDTRFRYSGERFLTTTPRATSDFWIGLQKILLGNDNEAEPATEFWKLMKRDAERLLKSEAPQQDWTELERDSIAGDRGFPPLQLEPRRGPLIDESLEFPRVRFRADRVTRWEALLAGDAAGGSPSRKLSQRAAGAAAMLHDLDSRLPTAGGCEAGLRATIASPGLVNVRWSVAGETLDLSWPGPRFETYYELERWGYQWNQYASRSLAFTGEDQSTTIQFFAALWMLNDFAGLSDTQLAPHFMRLNALSGADEPASVVLDALRKIDVSSERCRDWVIRTAALLSPEFAIPRPFAQVFFSGELDWVQTTLDPHWGRVRELRSTIRTRNRVTLAGLFLNPQEFSDACQDRISAHASAFRWFAGSVKEGVVDQLEVSGAFLQEIAEQLQTLQSSYSRSRRGSSDTYLKRIGQARTAVDRVWRSLEWLTDHSRAATATESPYALQLTDQVRSAREFLQFLEECDTLHAESLSHPANTWRSGDLCPSLNEGPGR